MIQRCTEKIVKLFSRLLSAILVECLYLWRKVINRGDHVQQRQLCVKMFDQWNRVARSTKAALGEIYW